MENIKFDISIPLKLGLWIDDQVILGKFKSRNEAIKVMLQTLKRNEKPMIKRLEDALRTFDGSGNPISRVEITFPKVQKEVEDVFKFYEDKISFIGWVMQCSKLKPLKEEKWVALMKAIREYDEKTDENLFSIFQNIASIQAIRQGRLDDKTLRYQIKEIFIS